MQKRGTIVDNDDFLPITGTYPEHHVTTNAPKAKTRSELQDQRVQSTRRKIEMKNAEFEQQQHTRSKALIQKPHILSEFYTGTQRFSSVKQRQEFERQEARKN